MKFLPADRFSISDEVLSQEVNGETVLLDLEGESYFGLNEVGTRIWQLIKSERTVGETLSALSDEYDVSLEQLESDVGELLDKLSDAGLVTRIAGA
jgi:hypothetical protein